MGPPAADLCFASMRGSEIGFVLHIVRRPYLVKRISAWIPAFAGMTGVRLKLGLFCIKSLEKVEQSPP
jgi:hypothetical protein